MYSTGIIQGNISTFWAHSMYFSLSILKSNVICPQNNNKFSFYLFNSKDRIFIKAIIKLAVGFTFSGLFKIMSNLLPSGRALIVWGSTIEANHKVRRSE